METKLSDRELDELCEVALEASPAALVITDADNILFMNARARSMLAIAKRADVRGHSIDDFVHPLVRDAARERRVAMIASGQGVYGYDTKLLDAQGEPVTTRASGCPLSAGEGTAILFELGEDRQACNCPLAVHRPTLMQAALEALPVPTVVHDDSRMLFLNAAARQLVHATREQTEGVPFSDFVHPDAIDAGRHRRRLVWSTGLVMRDIPLKLVATTGEPVRANADAFRHEVDGRDYTVLSLREESA